MIRTFDTDELRRLNPYDRYGAKKHHLLWLEVCDAIDDIPVEEQSASDMAAQTTLNYIERKREKND